ncbi:MAG: hypothetical protein ACI97A_003179 [Planctomycetota bacterium]|jgi:hypothetical protein
MKKIQVHLIIALFLSSFAVPVFAQDLIAVSCEPTFVGVPVYVGGDLPFTRNINATGSAPSNFSYQIRLSTNSTITTADILVGTFSLPPESLGSRTGIGTIPTNVAPGNYWIGMIIPPFTGEAYTFNNQVASGSLVTVVEAPDLEAVSITGPAIAQRGSSFLVTRNIANYGGALSPSIFQYQIRLSTNQFISSADTLLATVSSSTLGIVGAGVSIPTSVAPGNYYLGLLIPAANHEYYTANNSVAAISMIHISTPPPSITSVTNWSGPTTGGTTVHIWGTQLYAPIFDITFDGVSATNMTWHTNNHVSCTSPPAPFYIAQAGTIGVQTDGGWSYLSNIFQWQSIYEGSDEDLRLRGAINSLPSTGSTGDILTASGGDLIGMYVDSPLGSYDYHFLYLMGNAFPTGFTPSSPAGYPEVHVDLDDSGFFLLIDAGAPTPFFGPSVVLPTTNVVQFILPYNAAGFSVIFQAVALSGVAANGWFAATDGFELRMVP